MNQKVVLLIWSLHCRHKLSERLPTFRPPSDPPMPGHSKYNALISLAKFSWLTMIVIRSRYNHPVHLFYQVSVNRSVIRQLGNPLIRLNRGVGLSLRSSQECIRRFL